MGRREDKNMQQVGIKRAFGRWAWWETGIEEEQRPLEERQLQLEEACCLLVLYRDSKLLPISHITSPCFHLHNIMMVISLRLCNLICKTNWAGLDHHNLFQVVSNILVVSNIHSHLLSPVYPIFLLIHQPNTNNLNKTNRVRLVLKNGEFTRNLHLDPSPFPQHNSTGCLLLAHYAIFILI